MVKVTDFHPVNLGSTPTDTHMSYWWRQEGRPSKMLPCTGKSPTYLR